MNSQQIKKLYRYQVRLRWLCSCKENARNRYEVANPPEHTPILQNRKLHKQYPWTETATGEDRENIAEIFGATPMVR